ncbi:putative oxidoreductase [bioreactor metagenome]|uniref:Putative oxidoreductase n=1 Tax=bioreactor metagenome TaxID=1076179 RepID=A0A644W9K7_9ZZZZ
MAFDIKNKLVFISGGAGDIGSAIVKGFVDEKCRVIIGDLNLDAAEALKAEFPGADIITVKTDITDKKSVAEAAKTISEKFGFLDVLVNVAGILCRKSVFETEKEDFEKSMAINVIGTFMLTKEMIPLLRKSKTGGAVINISSLNGTAAAENRIVYGATKSALDMVSKSFALELGEFGITVNSIAPGVVDSKMCRVRLNTEEKVQSFCKYIPLGRLTTPADVVGCALFLASPYARGITGDVMLVDGGIIARQALPR